MLDRLVAVGIIAHVHDCHLANLMNRESIIAVITEGSHVEHQSRAFPRISYVLPIRPIRPSTSWNTDSGVVPAVAFCESVAPLERGEWALECAVGIAATHKIAFFVENIAVVHGTLGINLLLFFGRPRAFAKAHIYTQSS